MHTECVRGEGGGEGDREGGEGRAREVVEASST